MERMLNAGSGPTESNRTFTSFAEITSSQLLGVELKKLADSTRTRRDCGRSASTGPAGRAAGLRVASMRNMRDGRTEPARIGGYLRREGPGPC